jgi:hypothetical protein
VWLLERENIMTRKYVFFLALALQFALQIGSASACRGINIVKNGEILCMTTSDGAGQEFKDGRPPPVSKAEQARRIAEMRRGGTVIGGQLVSPFVPGSKQDMEWRAERRRRGF